MVYLLTTALEAANYFCFTLEQNKRKTKYFILFNSKL